MKMEKTKIVVKVGIDPDVKEVIIGENLSVKRIDGVGVIEIREGDDKIAEFSNPIYWRYVDEVLIEQLRKEMQLRDAMFGKLDKIVDNMMDIRSSGSELNLDTFLPIIHDLVHTEKSRKLIMEPDNDLLLLNLVNLTALADNELALGMGTETLLWCIYAVQQFVENNLVPGGPVDPNSPDWSWSKFQESFREASWRSPSEETR